MESVKYTVAYNLSPVFFCLYLVKFWHHLKYYEFANSSSFFTMYPLMQTILTGLR